MNRVEKVLHRTRKSIREACVEAGVEFDEDLVHNISECAHCSIWLRYKDLRADLDGNPICATCWEYEGA